MGPPHALRKEGLQGAEDPRARQQGQPRTRSSSSEQDDSVSVT